jgi:hypothetical protein
VTLILLWYEKGEERWHALSDSRLTTADNPLLESAPKLFTLPLVVHIPPNKTKDPFRRVLNTTVGFAYSGSSLSAMSTYSFAATACQTLVLKDGQQIPTIKDVADLVAKIAKHYVGEIWGRFYPEPKGKAEFFIFGHCRASRRPRAFSIKPVLQPQLDMEVNELPAGPPTNIFFLGDQAVRKAFFDRLDVEAKFPPAHRREFWEMLEQLIDTDEFPQIGGAVQHAVADQSGAWIVPTYNSPDGTLTSGNLTFLNVDLNTLEPVGGCTIGIVADVRHRS